MRDPLLKRQLLSFQRASQSRLGLNRNQGKMSPLRNGVSLNRNRTCGGLWLWSWGMANDDPTHLEQLAGQLARGFEVNELAVLSEFSSELPKSATIATGSSVRLERVSTFVKGAKDDRSSFGYIVSSIGSHWGVVVGEPEVAFLYHLVFENRADIASDAKPDSITGKVRAVTFDATLWKPAMSRGASMYEVGKTQYSPTELVRIGRQLVDFTNQRQKNDWCIWRLSPRVLELSNIC